MPVIAVGAALFAGAEIATVGIAAMSTFEIVAAVGAIAAGVGTVTGNKTLTEVGSVMALAGGVGALAQSSGVFGAAAGGSVADETSGLINGSGIAATDAATAASGVADPASTVTNNVLTPGSVESSPLAAPPSPPTDIGSKAYIESEASNISNPAAAPATPAAAPEGLLQQPAPSGISPAASDSAQYGALGNSGGGVTTSVGASGQTSGMGGIFKTVFDFAKSNDKTTAALLNVGGKLIGGLFDPTIQPGIDLTKAQTDLLQQRAANANAPAPVAVSGAPRPPVNAVTGTPYNQVPINPGLLNRTTP